MKRRVSLSILFFVFLIIFVSCNWFNTNNDNEISFTITGKLTTNGAMPKNYAEAMNARTALATAPSGKTIQYKVLLLAAEGATEPVEGAVSEVASDGSSYTIRYTGTSDETAQYYLRAVAYYMDGSNEVDVLLSPDTQLGSAVNLKNGTFSQDLEMRPATTGAGKAELTITLQAPANFTTASISDTTHFELDLTDISSGTIKIKNKGTNISAGSYNVTVNFYKSQTINSVATNILVYQFDDVINVFNNLTTNTWVDNGNSPHLTNDSNGICSCTITQAMLEDFKSTNFYVQQNWGGEEKGTFFEPFTSLAYAIQYINATGDSNKTYTIHAKTNASNEVINETLSINKKIKIEAYDTTPGTKNGYYRLAPCDGITLLNITSEGELLLESDRSIITGYPEGVTHGLVFYNNYSSSNCLISISGKMIMYGGYLSAGAGRYNGFVIIENTTNAVFEMYGGAITGNDLGTGICFASADNGSLKIAGKPCIYGNKDSSNNPKNVILPAGKKIQVVGPLVEGALIGVTAETEPTITEPVTITEGYGYQTGGYNAGVKPGRYFRGDRYGVTDDSMLASPAGEAVLAVSGGSISTKVKDDITIEIDHTNASNNTADRRFTFTVTKDKGAVAPATSTDLTSAEGLSYSYRLKDHTDIISNTPTAYYSTSANTLTLDTNLPQGKYKLEVEVTWDGNKYHAAFDIGYVKVDVPSGCVAVMGSTWNSSTTLCAGDADRKSNLFIAGRKLDIPNIIASDHEVTQTEWEQYMTYDPANTEYVVAETGTQKDVYPVYFVDWYATMVYCNLRTLGDSSFGSSREERLTHCVYSLNGTKDPELWLESLISGSRIYKIGNKFYFGTYCNEGRTGYNDTLDPTATSGYQFDLDADGWRIPTAVEWEFLARGGSLFPENQTIYSGTNSLEDVTSTSGTHEIKQTIPNSLKLYDMSGNMTEWCWDYVDVSGALGITTSTPITGRTSKVERRYAGGTGAINANSAIYSKRGFWTDNAGFRVIRTVLE